MSNHRPRISEQNWRKIKARAALAGRTVEQEINLLIEWIADNEEIVKDLQRKKHRPESSDRGLSSTRNDE
jgi:hypothetical protein